MNLANEFVKRFYQLIVDGKMETTAAEIIEYEFKFRIDRLHSTMFTCSFFDESKATWIEGIGWAINENESKNNLN